MALYALTTDPNTVRNTETGAFIPVSGNWMSDMYQAWLAAGNIPDPLPLPTFDDLVAEFEPQFEQWLEDVAASNNYKSSLSCISYKGSAVPAFNADAIAMFNWRDALWVWLYGWQSGLNGEIPNPVPTIDAIKALAPQPGDHGWVVHPTGITVGAQLPPGDATS